MVFDSGSMDQWWTVSTLATIAQVHLPQVQLVLANQWLMHVVQPSGQDCCNGQQWGLLTAVLVCMTCHLLTE